MKNLAVLNGTFYNSSINGPSKIKINNKAYSIMSKIGKKNGFKVIFGNPAWVSKNILKKGWHYDNGWKKFRNRKIDCVYSFFSPLLKKHKPCLKTIKKFKIPMMNHPKLDKFCWDKIKTYKRFKKIMPQTYIINNEKDLLKKVKLINSKKVVIKPSRGIRGIGIQIRDKKNIKDIKIKKNYILQEFIDTSKGVKSLGIKQKHDLRVLLINGEIDHCYFRLPKKGSFLANCARGAKKVIVPKEKLPKEILDIIHIINKKLSKYKKRIHSVDFIFKNDKKPYVVELESQPGFFYYTKKQEKYRIDYLNNLFKVMK